MALILVVEPDSTRASKIVSLARTQLRAEVLSVDSADGALVALAEVIPDVLLLSTLLSPHDEAAIAAALRGLGASGTHVQVLTIPILTAASPVVEKRRGLLSGLFKPRRRSVANGCEWELFAKQIADYVALAVSLRKDDDDAIGSRVELLPLPPPVSLAAMAEPEMREPSPAVDVLPLCSDPIEPGIAPMAAIAIEAPVASDEECWVPISLDELREEHPALPALPEGAWMVTPVASFKEIPMPIAPLPASPARASIPRKKNTTEKPAQDEWGFFDPDQCGFAALVAKLDDIQNAGDGEAEPAVTTARIIGY